MVINVAHDLVLGIEHVFAQAASLSCRLTLLLNCSF